MNPIGHHSLQGFSVIDPTFNRAIHNLMPRLILLGVNSMIILSRVFKAIVSYNLPTDIAGQEMVADQLGLEYRLGGCGYLRLLNTIGVFSQSLYGYCIYSGGDMLV